MPSDRLAALLRQRQLLTGHLAWLDAEIAEASGQNPTQTPTPSVAAPTPTPPSPPQAPASEPAIVATVAVTAGKLKEADPEALARANALADSLLKDYSARNPDTPQAARRSCLMLTLAIGLLGVAGLMAIYLIFYR
jgi:hypothetical protein